MCYQVLIYKVNDTINFKNYLKLSSKAMADNEKRGEDENTKN